MQWDELLGHTQQKEWLQTALSNGRLASSFLFVGSAGIGKRTFANLVAKSLLCRATDANQLEHCGRCEDCAQVEAGTHPDLLQVSKPADKAFLPLELLIGEREKRMREGLCHDISLRPYGGRRKIAILDDADTLNVEGANCLLKTLEEPPPKSILILVGSSLQRQLPTIRSRCQSILFRPLTDEQIRELLWRQQLVESEEQAQKLAPQCNGNLAEAQLIADPELREFQRSLLKMLASRELPIIELAKGCSAIVDAAGKDARVKRERMKLLLRISAAFYRALSLQLSRQTADERASPDERGTVGPNGAGDVTVAPVATPLESAVRSTLGHWNRGMKGATLCWKRCLQAIEEVDRNANQASLLEAWSADLAEKSGC